MQFQAIGIMDLESYLKNPDTVLIDVRTREEYDLYHILGSKNIPLNELEAHIKYLSKDKRYIFYCERGSNSLIAAKNLSRCGYMAYTVVGGLRAWDEQRLD